MSTSMQHVASQVTPQGITVLLNGRLHVIACDHMNYERVKTALKNEQYDRLEALLDHKVALNQGLGDFQTEGVEVKDGIIYVDGGTLPTIASKKALAMLADGHAPRPLGNFLKKLRQNPSQASQRETLLFSAANGFLIHEDGDIIAYKMVQNDYFSYHSGPNGKVRYMVGDEPSMPRCDVDDNREMACSQGLHAAAYEYARTFGGDDGRVMIVKINPADVVSIPSDESDRKMRVCKMTVIAEKEDKQRLPDLPFFKNGDLGLPEDEYDDTAASPLDEEDEADDDFDGFDDPDIDEIDDEEKDEYEEDEEDVDETAETLDFNEVKAFVKSAVAEIAAVPVIQIDSGDEVREYLSGRQEPTLIDRITSEYGVSVEIDGRHTLADVAQEILDASIGL